jgi:hypothetical protein
VGLQVQSRNYLWDAVAIVIVNPRLLVESVGDQERPIPQQLRVTWNLSENDPNSSRSQVGRSILEEPVPDSCAPRSRPDENCSNRSSTDRAGNNSIHSEPDELAITLGNACEVFGAPSTNCFDQKLTCSVHPWIFLSLPFQQLERGGKVLFARRANFESLQCGSKHGAVTTYICSERPSTPSAASFTVSESVGCECTVMPMSSDDPRYSNARTTS